MEKRLFVGNLPFSMTSDDLRSLFAEFGEIISAEVVINRMSNRSKGFGFVEFATNQEAQSAIDKLHETEQGGRKIIVAFAKPKPEESQLSANNIETDNTSGPDETKEEPVITEVVDATKSEADVPVEDSVVNTESAMDLDTDSTAPSETPAVENDQTS